MFWYNIRVRKDLLTIQQFAKLCRSTPRTLRLYEKLGLIVPIDRDRWNKYRLYDSSQGRKFFRIKLLQNFHVPLKEIGEIIKAKGTQQFLQNKTKSLKAEIIEKQKELKFLDTFEKLYFGANDISKVVKLKTVGPFNIFGHVVTREHYHQLPKDVTGLYDLVDKLKIPRYEKAIIQYCEPEKYKPLDTKIEISIVTKVKILPRNSKMPEGYFFKTFPQTRAYVYTYRGPTEFITLVYEKLHELGITEKLPVNFQPFDIETGGYHDPKPNDYDIVTKICFPLRKFILNGFPLSRE